MHRMLRSSPTAGLLLSLLASLFLFACDSDDGITSFEGQSTVTLSVVGLEPLAAGLNYQAWLVLGTPSDFWGYPLVLFNIGEDGEMVDPVADTVLAGPYPAGVDATGVFGVAVSLELTDELLNYSSFTFVLGGEVAQGTAALTTEHWIALDGDLSNASGRFALFTPTDDDPENELSGLWFADPTVTPLQAGLVVPEAPTGWTYEGWIELGEQVFSTGKFLSPSEPDSAGNYSGNGEPPTFPGEDFLLNAPTGVSFPVDLSGGETFITLEPQGAWDTSPGAPFFLRILEGSVPLDAAPLTLYELAPPASQLPSGTATIQAG